MPRKIDWTEGQDMMIRRMRAESASWDVIAVAVGVTRWTVIERGRRLGARLPPPTSSRRYRIRIAPRCLLATLIRGAASSEEQRSRACPTRFRRPYDETNEARSAARGQDERPGQ